MSLPSPTVRTWAGACTAICECGPFREHSSARVARLRGCASKRRSPRRIVIWISDATERPLSLPSHGNYAGQRGRPCVVYEFMIGALDGRYSVDCSLLVQRYPPRVGSVHVRFVWGRYFDMNAVIFPSVCTNIYNALI